MQERDKAKAWFDEAEKLLVKLDPDTSGPLDKRNDRIIARVDSAVASTKVTPRRAFKEPLVLLALVVALIAGALTSYLFVTRAMPAMMGPGAAASASGSVPEEVAEDVPLAPVETTVQNTVGAPATVPESCYPVNAQTVSLFFGQQLIDGKIFGRVPKLKAGQKRIKCDTDPVYDDVNKQTDVSGCKACIPYEPGTYNASDLMGSIFPQSDATCYVEPTNYRFHSWPSGKSIRFDCSKDAPYDAVRNCRDVSGCSIIIPDPTAE
ncbi:MAG: hypothetical protein P1P90_04020 [Patescibacteria group bacterium]|nr:hypothetical protein [Patescibacteria group bacterium]